VILLSLLTIGLNFYQLNGDNSGNMDSRQQVLEHLKRHGPSSILSLSSALGLSENAVRHHLTSLEREGFVQASLERRGVGRPTRLYALTEAAEGLFPKQYQQLLEVVLEQAQHQGTLEKILRGVVQQFRDQVKPALHSLEGEARLRGLLQQLDYGGMLSHLEATESGWELQAYNCMYKAIGCKFEPVCNLVPRVIEATTDLPTERITCQRDGERVCRFSIQREA
jgi:predicted ArsR family transcriptional regulator